MQFLEGYTFASLPFVPCSSRSRLGHTTLYNFDIMRQCYSSRVTYMLLVSVPILDVSNELHTSDV